MPRARSWTDAQLREAVASSVTLAEVSRGLGITPGGYRTLRLHIARLGLDTSHLATDGPVRPPKLRRQWTDDDFVEAVRTSHSVAEVIRRLGGSPSGGMHRMVLGRVRNLGLDTAHFVGRGWARGRRFTGRRTLPLECILVVNSTYQSTAKLRQRLVTAGLKPDHCEKCGLREWRGQPLPLALDHINGDHTDNRLENLRILCPNCHALTDTWCARNRPA